MLIFCRGIFKISLYWLVILLFSFILRHITGNLTAGDNQLFLLGRKKCISYPLILSSSKLELRFIRVICINWFLNVWLSSYLKWLSHPKLHLLNDLRQVMQLSIINKLSKWGVSSHVNAYNDVICWFFSSRNCNEVNRMCARLYTWIRKLYY